MLKFNGHNPREVGNRLLRAEGLNIAICDEASPFNRSTISTDAWRATTPGSDIRLFQFNGYMQNQMRAEHAIVWILVLWGVYRVRVVLHRDVADLPRESECFDLIGNDVSATISCPSGRIGWLDVDYADSARWIHIADVPPGRYRGRLTGEENHSGLTTLVEYPADGEDWTLHLAPVTSESLGSP